MPDRVVISNTSPLFYLHQIGRLGLLRDLYQNLYVPLAVEAELRKGAELGCSTPDLATLSWIHVQSHPSTISVPMVANLGPGEAEVIALGMAHPGCLLLLDDALGRSVAAKRGLTFTGTLECSSVDERKASCRTSKQPSRIFVGRPCTCRPD
jgi:predicted nucleic acid-binding protein